MRTSTPGASPRRRAIHPASDALGTGDVCGARGLVVILASVGSSFASTAASGPIVLALVACAAAGLISFASPCVVPLVPGYLSYLAGLVGAEAPPVRVGDKPSRGRGRVAGAALLFVLGFTVVFVLATATVFGLTSSVLINRELLQRIGGVVTILMGLVFIGLVPMLQREARFHPRLVSNLVGAPLLGAVFALGWTPCLGRRWPPWSPPRRGPRGRRPLGASR